MGWILAMGFPLRSTCTVFPASTRSKNALAWLRSLVKVVSRTCILHRKMYVSVHQNLSRPAVPMERLTIDRRLTPAGTRLHASLFLEMSG